MTIKRSELQALVDDDMNATIQFIDDDDCTFVSVDERQTTQKIELAISESDKQIQEYLEALIKVLPFDSVAEQFLNHLTSEVSHFTLESRDRQKLNKIIGNLRATIK